MLAGAKDFLTKPFDRTEVLLRVANLLETRALYRRLERHNASLQATIDDHRAEERKSAADHERRNARIDTALAPGGFGMVFQPVADLTTGSWSGSRRWPGSGASRSVPRTSGSPRPSTSAGAQSWS